jgi:hypothetical protein
VKGNTVIGETTHGASPSISALDESDEGVYEGTTSSASSDDGV